MKKNIKNYKNNNIDEKKKNNPKYGYIYLVKNPASNEVALCAWSTKLSKGDKVIFETRYGLDLGLVVGDASNLDKPYCKGSDTPCGACLEAENICETDDDLIVEENVEETDESEVILYRNYEDLDKNVEDSKDKILIKKNVNWIERLATKADLDKYSELCDREIDALTLCREKIKKHNLDMKLVTAHFLLIEPKIVFFFTSEARVDFRELVKDLVSVFRIRIELRQIGVRDESRVLGGLAVCGRDYCCHCVTDKLQPVSIKMAKEQNLSLNSMKISGPCGRLLCCLAYEQDFYVEEKLKYPPEGSKLKLGRELMKISDVNVISRKITLTSIDGRMLNIDATKVSFNSESKYWVIDKEYVKQLLDN